MADVFREEIRSLPEQMGWIPKPTGTVPSGRVVFAGMGGSALAAELAGSWLGEDQEWRVVRGDTLPGWVSSSDRVICVSCSGNTRETLSVWREAASRGIPRGAVASGGELLEEARTQREVHVEVPGGLAPRSSLGYLMRGCFSLLDQNPEPDWGALKEHLDSLRERLDRPPDEDMKATVRRPLALVAPRALSAVATRWMADFSENAKLPLLWWEFPEASHNAIMVLDDESQTPAPELLVLEPDSARNRPDWLEFLSLLREKAEHIHTVHHPHSDPWIEGVGLAYAGDWMSVQAAEVQGISAASIALMNEFKSRLKRRLKS